jgi:hypothetical protein
MAEASAEARLIEEALVAGELLAAVEQAAAVPPRRWLARAADQRQAVWHREAKRREGARQAEAEAQPPDFGDWEPP